MYKKNVFTAWVISLTFCLIPIAGASPLIGPQTTQAKVSSVEAIVAFDGSQEQLIERVVVKKAKASGGKIGWIRAFPSRPTISSVEGSIFEEAERVSRSEEPYYQTVRELVTHPSLITRVYRAVVPSAANTKRKLPSNEVVIDEASFDFIEANVVTSTINGSKSLPSEIESWFAEYELKPTRNQRRKIMQYCELGWVLALSTFDLSSVIDEESFTLSTTSYSFSTREAVHPHLFLVHRETEFRYWIVSDVPLQPVNLSLVRTNDLEEIENNKGAFIVTSQRKGSSAELPTTLSQNWAEEQEEVYFDKAIFDSDQAILEPQYFTPLDNAMSSYDTSFRGDIKDLLFCILLGLAPLFVLPESWLLYWLRHQSKLQRTRVNPNPLGTKLWSLYALAIGIFWALSQTGAGRAAAILPLLFGLLSIRTQETPKGRVIVTFAKKKKPVQKRGAE
ncbi:MAG: hypothetical protein VYC39_01120 [Myxococcota bacterium]|nr:hypothetical protein [Myxococcota bacterium]